MTFALSYLWAMLNVLQLAVHLPVFSLQFPGLAALLFNILFSIANFELIVIEDQVSDIF